METNNTLNNLKVYYKEIQLKEANKPKGRWIIEINNFANSSSYKIKTYIFETPPTNQELINKLTELINYDKE